MGSYFFDVARIAFLAGVSGLALVSAPAFAQSQAGAAQAPQADNNGLTEIVVTATKRAENVQDVPIAITAFSADALAQKGITEVVSVGNLAPNVTLDAGTPFSGSSSVLAAYIRGIGQNDFAFNLDPGVGIYLDGVYLARSVGANQDLLDIERIEILKGPQGTLFGRNTIGGAISIVTRDPEPVFGGKLQATTGSFNRIDVKGALNVPISDNLLSSVSFSVKNRDGYQKVIPFPADGAYVDEEDSFPSFGSGHPSTLGGDDEWTVRAKLKWTPTDTLKVVLAGDYLHQSNNGVASSLLATYGDPSDSAQVFGGLYNLCIGTPATTMAAIGLDALCGTRASVGTPLAGVNVDEVSGNDHLTWGDQFLTGDKDKTYATGNNFSRLKNWGLALTASLDLGAAELKSITAYRKLDWSSAQDEDGSPLALLETSFQMKQEQFSQELQLTGEAAGGRLKYVGGLYYFVEKGNLHDFVTFPGGLLQIDGQNLLKTKSYAAYANLNYELTDQLSVTFGARYTIEQKHFEGFQRDVNGTFYKLVLNDQPSEANRQLLCAVANFCYPDASDILRIYPLGNNHQKFTNFSPKIGLEYRPTSDLMVYASYSKGYKSGGWTTRLTTPAVAGATAPSFGPEKATSWELGIKSELADRKVILNVAGFYTDYKGIQLNFQVGTSPTLANAGDAEIYGFEAELQARPVPALTLQAAVGYTHARYTDVLFGVTGVTTDSKLSKTPSWKFSFSPQYTIDLASGGDFVIGVDYTHTSSLFNNTENSALVARPATDILNGSITYHEPDGRWSLSLGGTNLLKERYITSGQVSVAGGAAYGTWSRPREWYLTGRVNF
ncbi:TonB-dependent receptor [Novosphingobium album (ex Hu et al. 2023)]|uniref:TonB-dependent receptor n=1 Tax=Novosphingobium album (ex Hu et al. 2023) TaxID=2930093 RepID=A0ABT0AZL9_9SPHN|nr:TonB-dependent receptor [Novosphingobium album (ex Hu et al. 2023)]MCJ2178083.1 TonB-dependent receptor [Novosphingobium album (ex Hu et al. 2023)]